MGRYSTLTQRIRGSGAGVWRLHARALAARARGEDVIVLSVGDPDFATPAPIVDEAVRALRAGDTHYTPVIGREILRQAVADRHRRCTGQAVGVANVGIAAGAQSALFATAMCLLEAGDEVIALDPMYVTYEATLGATGARLVRVPQTAGDFRPDVAAVAAAITSRTRALFIINPNNPTGVALSAEERDAIAALAVAHDLWVVSDEVYADLVFDGVHHPMAGAGIDERCVTVGSLSKSHAMTGWRVGWTIGPAALIEHVEHLNLCMLYGLPGFSQTAAVAALTRYQDEAARMCGVYRARRDLVVGRLSGLPGLRVRSPQAGMFLMVQVDGLGMSGGAFAEALYEATGVSTLDGAAFGANAAHCVRLSFTLDEGALGEASTRIAGFVRGLSGGRA